MDAGRALSGGDRLRTEIDSRAEIHPYPDFYLFMNGNSEILSAEAEEDNVSIIVIKGSVVVVVAETSLKVRERNSLKLIAGNAKFEIGRRGYYHLNLRSADIVEMLIYDGNGQLDGSEIGARKRRSLAGRT